MNSSTRKYENLAADLLAAYKSGNRAAMRRLQKHFSPELGWDQMREAIQQRLSKLKKAPRTEKLTLSDARFLIANHYSFESWRQLKKHVESLADKSSLTAKFEAAADAVITGNIPKLKRLLRENPKLIKARSSRSHRSNLLHYVSANGVEDYRQKTPANIVEVTKLLLNEGAAVDAENSPGHGTTLGLVATSYHPAAAGVQIALLETLLDAAASPDGLPGGWNPLNAALANGRGDAARFLADRGARLDLEGAAGVGRVDVVKSFFEEDGSLKSKSTPQQLMSGFAWACEYGRTNVVDFMLKQGVDLRARLRHDGQTGLHWAALNGHADTVKLLLKRKAAVNAKDESYGGTPLGWAIYGWGGPAPEARKDGYYEVVELLMKAGAKVDREWLDDPNRELPLIKKVRADKRMRKALSKFSFIV